MKNLSPMGEFRRIMESIETIRKYRKSPGWVNACDAVYDTIMETIGEDESAGDDPHTVDDLLEFCEEITFTTSCSNFNDIDHQLACREIRNMLHKEGVTI